MEFCCLKKSISKSNKKLKQLLKIKCRKSKIHKNLRIFLYLLKIFNFHEISEHAQKSFGFLTNRIFACRKTRLRKSSNVFPFTPDNKGKKVAGNSYQVNSEEFSYYFIFYCQKSPVTDGWHEWRSPASHPVHTCGF